MEITVEQFQECLNKLPNPKTYPNNFFRVVFFNQDYLVRACNGNRPPLPKDDFYTREFEFTKTFTGKGRYEWTFKI